MTFAQELLDIAIGLGCIICQDEEGIYLGDPECPEHVAQQIAFSEN